MLKSKRTFKYRLFPNRKQRETLARTLEVCRQLYNDALQERRAAWKTCRTGVTFNMQSAQLPACKEADGPLRSVYSQVLQDVLHRVDRTYKAFLRRGRGCPRCKGKGWFDSFTYPQLGFSVHRNQLSLSKIGNVKIKLHRPLAGAGKTLTLKKESGQWYACFSCMVEVEPLPENKLVVGIDVGLESFAVTSDGEIIDHPRWFGAAQKALRGKQGHVARCQKRSGGWNRACQQVAKLHRGVFNPGNDFQHKLSRELINHYGFIAVDLNIQGLAGGRLAQSVHDAAWSSFIAKLSYKAESADRLLVKVDARRTSQQCPCGAPVPKKLWDRKHPCTVCGLNTTRDHASALEILRRGLRLRTTMPAIAGMALEAPSFSYGA
ncbi:MAG TPA: transposase [Terriglobales bacterium]|nr:transposase [Terriglobales bacterium]